MRADGSADGNAGAMLDSHVHSEWSWDARLGAMERTCGRAVALGLPGLAFTEHVDFAPWAAGLSRVLVSTSAGAVPFDVDGYQASLERCRQRFPRLRILSGVELGEPHRFVRQVRALLGAYRFDRILGSQHSVALDGELVPVRAPAVLAADHAATTMRGYLLDLVALVEGVPDVAVLAHIDYPKRYWPPAAGPFDEGAFEPEYRAVLRGLATSGRVLEINTSGGRGRDGWCPGVRVLRWWCEEGGDAVSFGSDAHRPEELAGAFAEAAAMAEACGFRPGPDPTGFWTRRALVTRP